jgi:hypothetical protein
MQQESSIPTLALHHLRMLCDESGIAEQSIAIFLTLEDWRGRHA